MAMKNKTRRALVLSVLSLILCCSMLVGTTFAWFTDSATGKNVIKSGNLDVSLWHSPCTNTTWGFGFPYGQSGEEVKANTKLFLNLGGEEILWEPGVVATDTFRVQNDGSLALKYELRFRACNASKTDAGHDLTEVVTISAAQLETPMDGAAPFTPAGGYYDAAGKLLDTNGDVYTISGSLLPGQFIDYWVWAEWIPTNHDNDYNVKNGLTLDLCVELVATQHTYEKDSYNGDQYDAGATFDAVDTFVAAGEDKAANNAALKAAIAAGDQDGDGKAIIQLGAGEYDADLYVVDTAKNLTINGQGADTKLNFKNGQVRLALVDSLTINNCTIGRMVDKTWGQLVFGSSEVAGGNYTISNCIFEGASTQGIYINQSVPATFNIKNCTFNGDFGNEGAITVQNNDGVDITVNVTGCDFKNIPATSHEIYMIYAYNGWTLNAEGVNAYWKTNP